MSRITRVLLALCIVTAPAGLPAAETPALTDVAAEVDKGVQAYNGRQIAYYESALLPDAVFVADDGAIFAGKERVMRQFTRVFGMTPPRQIAVSEVATGGRGEVAWARFKWNLTGPDAARPGVATIIFVREAGALKIASIHNTRAAHGAPAGAPHRH